MIQKPWAEADWDKLIRGIRQGQVIPIVGERLSRVEHQGQSRLYTDLLAQTLADDGLLENYTPDTSHNLGQLAQQHIAAGGDINDLYDGLLRAAEQLTVSTAPSLNNLAAITDFKLFVSLGIDTLLEQALQSARPSDTVEHRIYRPGEAQDIGATWPLTQPLVYHLFGRISAMPDYVVSHEDLLEFMHTLQSGNNRPRELFARLSRCSLLILGSTFSDWLALFFLRMSSELRLSNRMTQVIMVDDALKGKVELGSFVSQFSKRTRLVSQPVDSFVEELRSRWSAQAGETISADSDVFISYASEDQALAQAIRAGLLAHYPRLGIWLDAQGGLEGGDDYTRKIHRQIFQAKAFIPLISANTAGGDAKRFFRREWAWAEARAFELGNIPFILPVCADAAPDYGRADVPDTFSRLHWSTLPAGAVSEDFAKSVVRVIQTHKKQVAA